MMKIPLILHSSLIHSLSFIHFCSFNTNFLKRIHLLGQTSSPIIDARPFLQLYTRWQRKSSLLETPMKTSTHQPSCVLKPDRRIKTSTWKPQSKSARPSPSPETSHLPPGTEACGCYSRTWRGSSTHRAWRARNAWAPKDAVRTWGRWNHERSGPLRHTFIEMSEMRDDYNFHWENTQGNLRKRWEATAGSSHTHRARHPRRSQPNRKRRTVCPQRKNTTHGHQQKEEPPPLAWQQCS